MNKSEFDNAFRESVSLEFIEIPTDEESIDYTFSKKFQDKMDRLLRYQDKMFWRRISMSPRRIAIILLAILSIFTTACSVDAIRDPIVRCIVEIYEEFKYYFFEGDTTKEITYEYKLTEVPEDFEQIKKIVNSGAVITTYENEVGDVIEFSQFSTENTEHIVNDEGEVFQENILGVKVEFRIFGDIIECSWIQGEYFMNIAYIGDGDVESMKKMIESIE